MTAQSQQGDVASAVALCSRQLQGYYLCSSDLEPLQHVNDARHHGNPPITSTLTRPARAEGE
ncbi:MAG TPA: hypothetical protein VIV60_26915 [Polyangiaceae bacterium]